MSTVVADMTMSLDGFIADPDDGVADLFGWYGNGPVEVPSRDPRWTFHVSEASATHLRRAFADPGALICGRRVYDLTNGWGGNHPLGVPVFVVTHAVPPSSVGPFTFVTDGVESALTQARAAAGDRPVVVATPSITRQLLDLELLDTISVSLVPVLLGKGIRFFDQLAKSPVKLSDPTVIQGTGVTHLTYQVLR